MSEPTKPPMTKFSMLKAAEQIGVSQSTMHRYIKAGKVSAIKLESGGYEIDASELFRAFPPGWSKKGGTGSETPARDDVEPHETQSGTSNENGALRAEIRMLREMLERADLDNERQRREAAEAIDDYRRRLDSEAEERRALNARLLTYQTPPTPPDAPAPPSATLRRRGVFGWMRRAG